MALIYDDDGNVLGEEEFAPGASPLSKYMGKNVDYDDMWDEGVQAPPLRLLDPEAAKRLPTFRRLRISDLQKLPDPQWLIGDLIPEDSFTVLFGAPGSTKSFAALDMACCVATGTPYHGRPVRAGQVLSFVGEGLRGYKWRIEAWCLAHPDADMALLEKNLTIVDDVPHLLEKEQAGMLVNTAIEMTEESDTPLKLFIVDTLAKSLVGGDENSAQDVGMAIDACEKVRKATGATALVIHHTGVDGTRERGSTSLRGAADTSIIVQHEETSRQTTLTVKKVKDGEGGTVIRFGLAKFGHSVVLSSTVPTGIAAGATHQYHSQEKSRAEWAREALARKEAPF